MELSDYRSQIDRIDAELLQLFAERMQTAAGIAAYKKSHGLPVLDAGREREKLAQIVKAAPEDLQEEAVSLYRLLFSLSRSYQRDLLDEKTALPALLKAALEQTPQLFPPTAAVACQGVEGAYSQQACDKLFQHPSVFFCATFDKVFSAIEQGLCQYGVLPLENSTAGSVNAVYDLMQKHNFSIVRSVRLRVDHSLLALPGRKAVRNSRGCLARTGAGAVLRIFEAAAERDRDPLRKHGGGSPHGRRSGTARSRRHRLASLRGNLRPAAAAGARAERAWQLHPLYLHRGKARGLSGRPTGRAFVMVNEPGSLYQVLAASMAGAST